MRVDIIDLSANNPSVNFGLVAQTGVKAALIKATEGVGTLDKQCLPRCAQARAAGLKVGVYHYLHVRHGRAQDAAQQATEYLSVWKAVAPDLLPCVDVESAFNTDEKAPDGPATAAECQAAVTQFVNAIKAATGLWPIIYTSDGEWVSMGLSGLTSMAQCPLWVASYGSTATPPPPWHTYVAWQWSGSGSQLGVVGPCDLSQCDNLSALMPPTKTKTILGLLAGVGLIAALAYYVYGKDD